MKFYTQQGWGGTELRIAADNWWQQAPRGYSPWWVAIAILLALIAGGWVLQ